LESIDVESLVGRIERLERSNRYFKLTSAAVCGVLVATILSGGSTAKAVGPNAPQVVSAQRFVLAEGGRARGVWEITDNGSVALEMFDRSGTQRIVLQVGPQSNPTSIAFLDRMRHERVIVGESTGDEPLLMIRPNE
jgi:hypothetical protein